VTDAPFGSLDDLPESSEVGARRPRAIISVVALVAAVVLAVIVAVFAVGTLARVLEAGAGAVPTLDTVEQRTGIDLPDGSEVLAGGAGDGFAAEVALPTDELPDFAFAGYGPTTDGSEGLDSLVGDEPVARYYRAESATLVGSAALVERDGALVLFVDVQAVG
jgi:hypothetical protein